MGRRLTGPILILAALVATSVPAAAAPMRTPRPSVRSAAGPPDVILIITDDQRAGTLSLMPRLRRTLLRPGIRFRSAYVPNPSCCPSRASYFTGTYSHTNGVWRNDGPFGGFSVYDDSSTLATWLRRAGYRTGLFGKYINGYRNARIVPPGWSEWFAFIADDGRHYYGFDASHDGRLVRFPERVYSTVETYERVARFIRGTPRGRPLFAVWAPLAPHRPFLPERRYADAPIRLRPWRPPNYNELDVSDKSEWLRRTDRLTARQRHAIDADRRGQYRTLLSVDDGVERIVRALRIERRLTNALIVFAADNGLMWGEHRLVRKAVPYDGASHVPMVVRYDPLIGGRRGGSSMASLVVNIDIAPTVMDVVGVPPGSSVDGESLVPLLAGSAKGVRQRFIIEHAAGGGAPAYCGARSRRELYVRYATGEEEYYRLGRDPWNLENLAGNPHSSDEIRALRTYAERGCSPPPPGFTW